MLRKQAMGVLGEGLDLAAVEAGDAERAMQSAEEHIRSSAAALSIRNKTEPS